jgi:hypothetical protein
MEAMWTTILWRQFGAAIDMLENALRACPDELWSVRLWSDPSYPPGFSEFWYVGFHTLFWVDRYLSGSDEGFAPPAPFTLGEMEDGLFPERQYTRGEILSYLEHCRRKCRATIEALTDEKARQRCSFRWGEVSFAELLLDNMRHVQEHGAQLSMILGQKNASTARWVAGAKSNSG